MGEDKGQERWLCFGACESRAIIAPGWRLVSWNRAAEEAKVRGQLLFSVSCNSNADLSEQWPGPWGFLPQLLFSNRKAGQQLVALCSVYQPSPPLLP